MAKKIAAIILGVLDAVLLIVIIISVSTGWRIRRDAPVQSEEDQSDTASLPFLSDSSAPPVVSDEPSVREIPDANSISTSEYPVVGDIVSFDIHHGWTGFSPDSVYIPEAYLVIGGWKAYFVIDPDQKMGQAIEKFANVNISFAQSGMTVTVDWYRTFNGDLTKGTPDNAPDSSFSGEWSSGMIDAVGSGRIILGEFCYDHGREYAAGRMIWPDGTESVIGLIRP